MVVKLQIEVVFSMLCSETIVSYIADHSYRDIHNFPSDYVGYFAKVWSKYFTEIPKNPKPKLYIYGLGFFL